MSKMSRSVLGTVFLLLILLNVYWNPLSTSTSRIHREAEFKDFAVNTDVDGPREVDWSDVKNSKDFENAKKKKNSVKIHKNKFSDIKSEKWIVVTTVSLPTEDVMFLSRIPGWKVVVVGDTKTPSNWRYPNCVFLSVDDQMTLGYNTVSLLPVISYARKNVGYLFAIEHGAKIIYETDDDNRPTDMLNNFVDEPTMWGLLYNGSNFFNPYRHFGQPTLWPRGYPLSAVGENITTNYELNHFKSPSIQQGVVNGDPDVDAIFRLTRKQTSSVLNVTFDARAPPAIVPWGVFSPFNSQNTLFLYDALWAMMIPTTTAFRVCDIWRGYWAQRLLWEMGGNLGFFPPNAFQKRNSHSYLLDAIDEKDLYFKTEDLLDFLKNWKCKISYTFFQCVVELSVAMYDKGFWGKRDADLSVAWVTDLKSFGYIEPHRIQYDVFKTKALHVVIPILNKKAYNNNDNSTSLLFWADEHPPPNIFKTSEHNTRIVSSIKRISAFCPKTEFNMKSQIHVFQNILLIITFNHPFYKNIPILEAMYRLQFPQIVYCGSKKEQFEAHLNGYHVTFIEVNVTRGLFGYRCLVQAMKMNYNVDGYLYINDDVLLNTWTIPNLPLDKLWLFNLRPFPSTENGKWIWLNRPQISTAAFAEAINTSKSMKEEDAQRFNNFTETLAKNTGYSNGLFRGSSDIVFVPRNYRNKILYFLDYFAQFDLFLEIAVPTVFGGVEDQANIFKLSGSYLWVNRSLYAETFNENHSFIHPLKLSDNKKAKINFLCEQYFPRVFRNSKFKHGLHRAFYCITTPLRPILVIRSRMLANTLNEVV